MSTRIGPGGSQPPFEHFNLSLHSGDDAQTVQNNRRALVQSLGLPSTPRWLRQVHGTTVTELGPLSGVDEPKADAAVSRLPGTVLAILAADCLPVLLCSDDGGEIAAVHAGWRGLAAGVIEATVHAMTTPSRQLLAWLGPCIGAATYEVGQDVRDAFVSTDTQAEAAFAATRVGHWHCDVAQLARQRLQRLGVPQVYGGGFDTFTDARLYSYRRDGERSGRFASLIWTRPHRLT